jgi:hypothetical protein
MAMNFSPEDGIRTRQKRLAGSMNQGAGSEVRAGKASEPLAELENHGPAPVELHNAIGKELEIIVKEAAVA